MNFFKYLYKGIVEFLKMLGIAVAILSWIFISALIDSSSVPEDQKIGLFVAITALFVVTGVAIYGWLCINCKDNCKPE